MALVVLDASIVIGHLSERDAHHDAASAALTRVADDDLRMPASAYAEALVGPVRRGTFDRARELIASLAITIDPIDGAAAEEAARLRARHQRLRLPDALVIAHGEVVGADTVMTTDRAWRRYSARAVVVR